MRKDPHLAGMAVIVSAEKAAGSDGDSDRSGAAVRLADRLGIPVLGSDQQVNSEVEFILRVNDEGLALELNRPGSPGPLRVDFEGPTLGYRIKDNIGRQALIRAVGVKPGLHPVVLDATAGLGKDAYLLATTGCQVCMLERDPVIHALLEDGLRRARSSSVEKVREAVQRMTLSLTGLAEYASPSGGFDVVYLDPMFPKRSKSARVKKDMYILQQYFQQQSVAGLAEGDDTELLQQALTIAQKRVVVKRPARAPDLGGKVPTFRLSGRSSRFDVYVTG